MHDTIAVIQVETQRENELNRGKEFTRLFKVETPTEMDTDRESNQAALWQYNNSGYAYLESLGVCNPDDAVEEARKRVRDYSLDEEVTGVTVTRRD